MRLRAAIKSSLLVATTLITTSILLLYSFSNFNSSSEGTRQSNFIKVTRIFPQGGDDVIFNQPWDIPEIEVIDEITVFDNQGVEKYLVSNFSFSKGLGNLMFQYASLHSLAKIYGASVILPNSTLLRRAFNLDATFVTDQINEILLARQRDSTVFSKDCCSFTPPSLFRDGSRLSAVIGYLQNPRYFHPIQQEIIRKQFTFIEPVEHMATSFLRTLIFSRALARAHPLFDNLKQPGDEAFETDPDALTEDVFFVGVHVRRGMDITVNERNRRHGHTAAPLRYYELAMNRIREQHENVVFVICSDDPLWARKNFPETDKGL
uniref:L-Fucosyltransferase n=1 Tax=Heterorhabditis bacteriophora TaxID=37862 RepID=A0A1I7XPC7_HETBA